jgi:hypothetical protein
MTQQNTGNFAGEAASRIEALPRYDFDVPEEERTETDPKTLTIRQLTYAEEKTAMEAKEHGGGSFLIEGTKRAIYAADGKRITWTDNQAESFFEGLSPAVRELAQNAFASVNMPKKKNVDTFLASKKITIRG